MKHKLLGIFAAVLLVGTILALTPTAFAKPNGIVINVNSHSSDEGDTVPGNAVCETQPGNGVCTLRAAIQEANAFPGAEIINLEVGQTYTINRSGLDTTATDGDLDILTDLTINGHNSIIDGNGNVTNDRVFEINNVATVVLSDLTVQNGKTAFAGGGILNYGGVLVLDHVTVQSNTSAVNGGGISNLGKMSLYNSTISGNTVTGAYNGGGMYLGGDTLIQNSAILNNQAPVTAGGIYIASFKTTIANSTIGGNKTDGSGGGLAAPAGTTYLFNVTITDNFADNENNNVGDAGGIYSSGTAQFYIMNSILANNYIENGMVDTLDDCAGSVSSQGYNIVRTTSGCTIFATTGDKFTYDPKVNVLGNYGGLTQTYSLQSNSPAIDNGNPGNCTMANQGLNTVLKQDQRGYGRPANGGVSNTCDIGAFEYNAVSPVATATPTNTPPAPATATPTKTATSMPTLVPCQTKPAAPVLVSPANGGNMSKAKAKLDWQDTNCATKYSILVKQDSKQGTKIAKDDNVLVSLFTTPTLTGGHSYFWQVSACNVAGCTKSPWFQFSKP